MWRLREKNADWLWLGFSYQFRAQSEQLVKVTTHYAVTHTTVHTVVSTYPHLAKNTPTFWYHWKYLSYCCNFCRWIWAKTVIDFNIPHLIQFIKSLVTFRITFQRLIRDYVFHCRSNYYYSDHSKTIDVY